MKRIEDKRMNLHGPDGLMILLRTDEIFPEDPGMGTPAVVEDADGNTATFDCASGERELDGAPLSDEQIEWLDKQAGFVDSWLTHHFNAIRKENSK